jgi:crossover junction endodeoxyribonuclease RusA
MTPQDVPALNVLFWDLPYPPSVNHYYRMFRGRMVISAEGRAYRSAVQAVILSGKRIKPLEGNVIMGVLIYPPDTRRRDLDNVIKALWDALQHAGVYRDDSQISRYTVERRNIVTGGAVRVAIA